MFLFSKNDFYRNDMQYYVVRRIFILLFPLQTVHSQCWYFSNVIHYYGTTKANKLSDEIHHNCDFSILFFFELSASSFHTYHHMGWISHFPKPVFQWKELTNMIYKIPDVKKISHQKYFVLNFGACHAIFRTLFSIFWSVFDVLYDPIT